MVPGAATGSPRRRRETARHVDARLEPHRRRRRRAVRPGPVRDALRVRRRARCRSRSARSGARRPRSSTPSAPSARSPRALCAARAGRRRSACAARSARALAARRGRGRRRRRRRGRASGSRRCARSSTTLLAHRERYGRVVVLYGGRSPAELLYTRRARALARALRRRGATSTVDRPAAGWRGRVGVVTTLDRRAPTSTRRDTRGDDLRARGDDALRRRRAARARRRRPSAICVSLERSMKCAIGHCGHCQLGPAFICKDGPVVPLRPRRAAAAGAGAVDGPAPDARGLEVRLLRRLPAQRCSTARTSCCRSPARSTSPTSSRPRARTRRRPLRPLARRGLDHHRRGRRAHPARPRGSRGRLVTIGACATAGGIQALRNFADVEDFIVGRLRAPGVRLDARAPRPRSRAHVPVDFELHGCPIDKRQLLEVISAFLNERRPGDRRRTASASSASARGNVCVMVAHGTPCLGPVTHAGCGALCPAYHRGCYGCFGPMETPEHRRRSPPGWPASGCAERRPRARLPHLQRRRAEPFRAESEAAMS